MGLTLLGFNMPFKDKQRYRDYKRDYMRRQRASSKQLLVESEERGGGD